MSENLLLAALPKEERARLDPFLESEMFKQFDVMIEPDEPIRSVYFPNDCVTSTIQELSDGSSIETGLGGLEGFVGVSVWLNSRTTPARTLVQVPGRTYRMDADVFLEEVVRKPSALNGFIARYIHAFLMLNSYAAACNRLHSVDERLCRWLKMIHNRIGRDEFPLRHEFLGHMLGVHRPTISTAANILQKAGLINYSRGTIRVLDSEGLMEGACECYELMESQFDKIFDRPWRELAREQEVK